MTETSVEFAKLEYALVEAHGIVADLPAHDVKDRLHELKLRSYVLLCHAAIEEYLERASFAVLHDSLRAFGADGIVRDPLIAACSFYKIVLVNEITNRSTGDSLQNVLTTVFQRAASEHRKAIDENHGVKTKDQESLFLPIGASVFQFDRLLSQSLNSFGVLRGGFAHGIGIKTIAPRAGQESKVRNLVRLLLAFDNHLCERHRVNLDYAN
jgi:hypothetical protein